MADAALHAVVPNDVAIRPLAYAFVPHANMGILAKHITVFTVIKICHVRNVVEFILDLVAQSLYAALPPTVYGRWAATDFLDQR